MTVPTARGEADRLEAPAILPADTPLVSDLAMRALDVAAASI
jgi:hypothetical protein